MFATGNNQKRRSGRSTTRPGTAATRIGSIQIKKECLGYLGAKRPVAIANDAAPKAAVSGRGRYKRNACKLVGRSTWQSPGH